MKSDYTPQAIADKYIGRDGKPPPKPKRLSKDAVVDQQFVATLTALSKDKRLNKFQRDVIRNALGVVNALRGIL